jgi:hypothetical protein
MHGSVARRAAATVARCCSAWPCCSKGLDGAVELVVAIVLLLIPQPDVHRLVADVVARD